MDAKDAAQLRNAWKAKGNPHCDHLQTDVESDLHAEFCITCGKHMPVNLHGKHDRLDLLFVDGPLDGKTLPLVPEAFKCIRFNNRGALKEGKFIDPRVYIYKLDGTKYVYVGAAPELSERPREARV